MIAASFSGESKGFLRHRIRGTPLRRCHERLLTIKMSSQMTEAEFQETISFLRGLPFREDFGAGVCRLYTTATATQRSELRHMCKTNSLGGPKTWRDPTDHRRSDLTREQRMRQRLIAMSMEDGGPDDRDDILAIAYCYHNLALLGMDADKLLKEVAEISAPAFAKLLLNFVRRSPDDKSPESFKLTIEQMPDGPGFEFSL
jgi:hypothetical protein